MNVGQCDIVWIELVLAVISSICLCGGLGWEVQEQNQLLSILVEDHLVRPSYKEIARD